jgi:hypothetical protein
MPLSREVEAGSVAKVCGVSTRRAVLMLRAAEQREMVRWWSAECRDRNVACRRRFTAANVGKLFRA